MGPYWKSLIYKKKNVIWKLFRGDQKRRQERVCWKVLGAIYQMSGSIWEHPVHVVNQFVNDVSYMGQNQHNGRQKP